MTVIVLFRSETGKPLGVLDGCLITEMRTSAVTAAYIDAIAAFDVKTLAILAVGTQRRRHIEALSHVRKFEKIRINAGLRQIGRQSLTRLLFVWNRPTG
ncbi:MAG: hypothetical protein ACXV8Q_20505 [Methylobacter sp.]